MIDFLRQNYQFNTSSGADFRFCTIQSDPIKSFSLKLVNNARQRIPTALAAFTPLMASSTTRQFSGFSSNVYA